MRIKRMNVTKKIQDKINRMRDGTTFKYQQLDIAKDEFSASAKAIERLRKKGTIKRVTPGVFYKPKKTVFGELRPRDEELIKTYLFKGTKRIAYITGTALYNRMGLTTQVPRIIKVASSGKRITVNTNTVIAKPIKSYVDVTNNNFILLQILDVLKDLNQIPDLDKKMAIKYLLNKVEKLSSKERALIIKYALKYPPRTRALLGALLSNINKKRDAVILLESLNPLTTYRLGIKKEILKTAPDWNIK